MNVFAKFNEIPSMILQDIKERKRYGHTVDRSDNLKTVYPPTNTVCGGYKDNFDPIFGYAIKLFLGKGPLIFTPRRLENSYEGPRDS